jgi:3-hydroxyisobutyrate dehydrogenase-like beta-hydroxyacid dehydrogenase
MRISFLGLGKMGTPIDLRLIAAGLGQEDWAAGM